MSTWPNITWTCVSKRPGQERRAGDVDLLVAVQPDADLVDPPVDHRDVGVGDRRAGSVEHPSAGEYRPHLGSFRSLVQERRAYRRG